MFYNVAQLLRESVGASRQYDVSETVGYESEGWGSVPVEGEVTLIRTHRGILVRASLQTSTSEQCGRCLQPYRQAVTTEIEEEFFPLIDVVTGHPLEVPWQDEPYVIDENHVLDLTEPLRQAILLARPMQLLCRPECAGLCPECGKDRNQGGCRCTVEAEDPRWAALRDIFPTGRSA